MRRKIERKRDVNSLFDLPTLTRAIEAAYLELFAAWRDGGPLRSTAHDARQTVAAQEAILRSHHAGGTPAPAAANG